MNPDREDSCAPMSPSRLFPLAILCTAVAEATWPALAGAALIVLGLWLKARLEEEFLRRGLGPEAYDSRRRRVPMLLPLGPRAA